MSQLKRYYLDLIAPDGASLNWSWQRCRRDFLRKVGKVCVICGTTKKIQVHHKEPRHLFPERSLDSTNLIALCRDCHFHSGHLCDYRNYNKNIFDVAFYANEHSEFGVPSNNFI